MTLRVLSQKFACKISLELNYISDDRNQAAFGSSSSEGVDH